MTLSMKYFVSKVQHTVYVCNKVNFQLKHTTETQQLPMSHTPGDILACR